MNYDQLAQRLGIVEKEELLRCQGRLKHAALEQEGREPLISPKEHLLTNLIDKSYHEKVLHSELLHEGHFSSGYR